MLNAARVVWRRRRRAARRLRVCRRRCDVSCVRGVRHGAEPRRLRKGRAHHDANCDSTARRAWLTVAAVALPVSAAAQIDDTSRSGLVGPSGVPASVRSSSSRPATEVREAVVIFGDATIDGHVDQDVVVVLGKAQLGSTAVVDGNAGGRRRQRDDRERRPGRPRPRRRRQRLRRAAGILARRSAHRDRRQRLRRTARGARPVDYARAALGTSHRSRPAVGLAHRRSVVPRVSRPESDLPPSRSAPASAHSTTGRSRHSRSASS